MKFNITPDDDLTYDEAREIAKSIWRVNGFCEISFNLESGKLVFDDVAEYCSEMDLPLGG